jgi:diguanylate cyclase (GGDEF)-like protein
MSYVISHSKEFIEIFNSVEFQKTGYDTARSVLVQIYAADIDADNRAELITTIMKLIPNAKVVSATTIGEIANGKSLANTTVIGISLFQSSDIKTVSIHCTNNEEKKSGQLLGEKIKKCFTNISGVLLLSTPLTINMGNFLDGLNESDIDYHIFGGGAGNYIQSNDSLITHGDKKYDKGAIAVVFSGEELFIELKAYLGWRPLSKELTITDINGMEVISVDNEPAFNIYRRYLGIENDENFFLNALEFPFLLNRNGNVIARVPVSGTPNGGVQFIADLELGETFRIGYGDPHSIIDDAKEIHTSMKEFGSQVTFLYSCGCRRFLMQEDVELETLPFEDIAPTFGFYTYGEFCSVNTDVSLLNSTMVAVSMREGINSLNRELPRKADKNRDKDPYSNQHSRIVKRLVKFISTVTEELREANAEITKLSLTDKLTQLSNRMKLDMTLEELKKLFKRYHQTFSVILLDVDHFKKVNDQYGHLVGDEVLKTISHILSSNIRSTDVAGRWGGEEFLVVVPNSDIDNAYQLAEKIRLAIENKEFPVVERVTVSIGVSTYQRDETISELVSRADNALYAAKNAGRNMVKK